MNIFNMEIEPSNPWCIQIEPTEGCNRRCWFCGLISLPKEKQKGDHFMKVDLIEKVFSELNAWLPKIRVEINLHGEPMMNPAMLDLIAAMRKNMPSCAIILQTNTDVWYQSAEEMVPALFNAGVNNLVLNAYEKGRYQWWTEKLQAMGLPYIDYYWDNPRHIGYNRYVKPSSRSIFLLDDLGTVNSAKGSKVVTKDHPNKKLHASAGSSSVKTIEAKTGRKFASTPMAAKCSKVYREINLGYDGSVAVCCLDWHNKNIIGNAYTQRIDEIWNSEKYWAIRQLLFRRRRDLLSPCNACSDPTTRVGLVSDPGFSLSDSELLAYVNPPNIALET